MKYSRASHVIYNLSFHLILTSKYRKPYFNNINNLFLKRILSIACHKANVKIENIEVMPDHIHLFIRALSSSINVSKMVQIIKGYTSFIVRKKYDYLKKYKAFWSPTYFIESIGNISEKIIKKYIDNQKVNVKPNYKYKNLIKKSIKDKNINYFMYDSEYREHNSINVSFQVSNNESIKRCRTDI